VHSAARASSFEEIRDGLANGHGISTCGGEGFSETRDEWGYSRPSGSWSHAYKVGGADQRPEIIKLYGEPMVLQINNWGGSWNHGGRDVYDSAKLVPPEKRALWISLDLVNPKTGNIMIPKGAWWSKWSQVRRRSFFVKSGIHGWAKKKLPGWHFGLEG
jgi:hypothetical protein